VDRFKSALNARWTVVPFLSLAPEIMREIVVLKLNRIVQRLLETHKIAVTYEAAVVDAIASRCTEADTGARNVDHVVQATLLPRISTEILERMAGDAAPVGLHIRMGPQGEFELSWQGNSELMVV
jgi:type VI secretion system protein VasG